MMLSLMLMLTAADLPPERPAKVESTVRVHRKAKSPPKTAVPPKAGPSDNSVTVHKDKVPTAVEKADGAAEPVTEFDDNPVFSADIAFQRCIEREADAAALAKTSSEDFKTALPQMCTAEETRLAQRFADSRADGDPMRQTAGVPRSKSRALVFDYTEGLRQIAQAGYINLVKGRAPMRLDKALADWKKK